VLRGTLAASVTPLRDGGNRLDDDAVAPLVAFLAGGGLDGLLALGTTGEGILLAADERRRAAELFVEAGRGRIQVAVHCGAQTTRDTVALAQHAAAAGADAVAVIGPPYYPLDDEALLGHFAAAAAACAPTPFYVYEFAARSGYAVPLSVLARLRELAPNLVGLKVSDRTWADFEPYLLDGLDVFVGPESLIRQGLERGASGVVSGVAAAFPEAVVARSRVEELREGLERFPFHAAAKHALRRRGVPIAPDVRAPLRQLTDDERKELDVWLESQ
jgi:dihydrodipicolinate synthase/N-acetylneuraminate lyase